MDFLQFLEILFVRSSILIVLTGMILFLFGDRLSANLRQAVLTLTLLGLLLLPALRFFVPDYSIQDLYTGRLPEDNRQTSLVYLDSDGLNLKESAPQRTFSEGASPSDRAPELASKPEPPVGGMLTFTDLIFIVWISGVVLLLIWFIVGFLRIQYISQTVKYSVLSNNIPWMSDLLDDLKLNRSVRVAYSDKVSVPMVWGVFYPTLLLPLSARGWGRERLRTLLLHEFAHIRRLDYPAHLLGKFVTGVYWMNPLVWIAARKMSEEQEKACDNHVLAAGTPSYEYAQHLLDFMKSLRQQKNYQMVPAITMGLKMRNVKERMQMLLDESARRKSVSLATLFLLFLISGCTILPVAALNMASNGIRANGEYTFHFIEAESTELPDGILTQPDIHASGEKFISVKDDMNSRDKPPASGSFTYNFSIAEAGTYAIWGRTKTDDDEEDSFWVRMDGGEWIKWNNIPESDMWRWNDVHDSEKDNRPVLYQLDQGDHTLELAYREEKIALDKLLITNNINYRPEDKDPILPTRQSERIRMAATSGRIDSHFLTLADEGALNGQYLSSTHHRGDLDEPPAEGDVVYKFQASKDGKYRIWGRVMAESGSENSFWIRVDEKPWVLWNGFEHDGFWRWVPVYDYRADSRPVVFDLKKGAHTIEIAHRERNAGLDEIVITDAPGFYPRALAAR